MQNLLASVTDATTSLVRGAEVDSLRNAATVESATGRLSPQQKPARLRRKGPMLWAALALLVLAADFMLASLAWLAVDFVMG